MPRPRLPTSREPFICTTMKSLIPNPKTLAVLAGSLTLLSCPALAQEAPAAAPSQAAASTPPPVTPSPSAPTEDQVLTLDPFTVTSETEGYQAVDTLGGARIRTSLADTPSSISVITKKFMTDLGITNATSLLVYTNNTEVSGLGGNFSGVV